MSRNDTRPPGLTWLTGRSLAQIDSLSLQRLILLHLGNDEPDQPLDRFVGI